MQDHENMDNLQGSSKSDNKSEKVKDTPKLTRHGHEIPRPKNCFLAYRMEVASTLVEHGVDNNIPNISKLVADLWRTEPEAVKQRYREIAAKEKKEHKQLYPDYKYMPKRKHMCEGKFERGISGESQSRKLPRIVASSTCNKSLKKPLEKTVPRPNGKKPKLPKKQNNTIQKRPKKSSRMLTRDGRQRLYNKFTLVKKITDSETPTNQIQYASPPSIFRSQQEEGINGNLVNRRIEVNEVNPQIFGNGHFTFGHPKAMACANTFWNQETVSLHRKFFDWSQTSGERTFIQVPSIFPQAPTVDYMSDAEAYPVNGTEPDVVCNLMDSIGNNQLTMQLYKDYLRMLEGQASVVTSSLTPSLSSKSQDSEDEDEPAGDELESS